MKMLKKGAMPMNEAKKVVGPCIELSQGKNDIMRNPEPEIPIITGMIIFVVSSNPILFHKPGAKNNKKRPQRKNPPKFIT